MDRQKLSAADVREVQLMPSGLVIIRLAVPVFDKATKSGEPPGVPYVTEIHTLAAAEERIVQFIPLGLVITLPA
jgi:hypothetical protein